jgi:Ion channel
MSVTGERFRILQRRLGEPLLTALTIMLAVLLFVVAPMQAEGVVAAVAGILVAIALIVAATVLRLRQPSAVDIYLESSSWLISGLTLTLVVARAVFAPGEVTLHRVIGAVLLYLSVGLTFVALFSFVALWKPNAFTGLGTLQDNLAVMGNLIYFSFVTLTSVGYGDVVPVDPYARSLANVEAIIGQLYPATLLARLVTLELEDRRRKAP